MPDNEPPRAPAGFHVARHAAGWLLILPGVAALAALATVPLAPPGQAALGLGGVAIAWALSRANHRAAPLALLALSLAATLRYFVWRACDTLEFVTWPETLLGGALLLAELVAAKLRLLGDGLAIWPRHRAPVPLPDDPAAWPQVDVVIVARDEPVPDLRATVLAALTLDWPAERLAVHLLDLGGRDAARDVAAQTGGRYVAGAGEAAAAAVNAALAGAAGAFVVVLAAGDVPTRALLQLCVGHLLTAPRLAFVQPALAARAGLFARHGAAGAELSATRLQDGRDLWGAAMLDRAGAVLRRAALDAVGGFAAGTDAPDAHTTLRLHRAGWDGAFLDLPLVGAWTPPTLAAHLRAARRRAGGALHVLRRGSPAFGPRLSPSRRLAHAHAGWSAVLPLCRAAFLIAPLGVLLAGQTIIAASAPALLAYAVPHMLHGMILAPRAAGRRPGWTELRETVLALPLAGAVLAGLIWPRRGAAGTPPPASDRFDWRSAAPHVALAALLGLGVAGGVLGLAQSSGDWPTLALYTLWAATNLLLTLAAVALARPVPEEASEPAAVAVRVETAEGAAARGVVRAVSASGATVTLPEPWAHDAGLVRVLAEIGGEALSLPASVRAADGATLRLLWQPASLDAEADVVRFAFGRADAWRGGVAAAIALVLIAAPAAAQPARTPATGTTVRVIPQTIRPSMLPLPFPLRTTPIGEPPPPAAPAPVAAPAAPPPVIRTVSRQLTLSLRQLGADGPLTLTGAAPERALGFGVRADEVVTAAHLSLSGDLSLALSPAASGIAIALNGQGVGAVEAGHDPKGFSREIPLAPALFGERNRLSLRFAGRVAADCDDPFDARAWATVHDGSTLTLTLERLPAQRDLARLPRPFLDPAQPERLTLPFVLAGTPGNDVLRAAGIAAGWFATLAGPRGARFPALGALPAQGDAVVLAVGGDGAGGLAAIDGPTLAVLPNPNDSFGSLLVIGGRNGEEAAAAATALAFGGGGLSGAVAVVRPPAVGARVAYDAPFWIDASHPVRLGDLAPAGSLRTDAYAGGVSVPLRSAPDLVTWRAHPYRLALRTRVAGPAALDAASRLEVAFNDAPLATLPLGTGPADVAVPAHALTGADTLRLRFDARPATRVACAAAPGAPTLTIDPDSTLDLSAGRRFAVLPDLALFVRSLLPFTRMADLSDTAIVLPDRPDLGELSAFLDLMGRFGAETGLPGLRVIVARADAAASLGGRDLLLIGAPARLRPAAEVLRGTGVRPEDVDAGTAVLTGGRNPLSGRSVVALLAGGAAMTAAMDKLFDPARSRLIGGDLALLSAGPPVSHTVAEAYAVGALPWWMWPDWYLRGDATAVAGLTLLGCAGVAGGLLLLLRNRA